MSVIIHIDGREALPIRSLPFVSGWMLSPDVVAMGFANTHHWNTKLEEIRAYHLMPDGQYASMLPKEWDGIEADLQILSQKLKQNDSFELESYPEWRMQSVSLLPPNCFVWRDEIEQAFKLSYSKDNIILKDERPGDRELNFLPRIPLELINIVMQGFIKDVLSIESNKSITIEQNANVEIEKPNRRQRQQLAILRVIAELGYSAMSIPDGGKSEIKSILLKQPQLFTSSGFDHAWSLGVRRGLFRMINHDKFSRN